MLHRAVSRRVSHHAALQANSSPIPSAVCSPTFVGHELSFCPNNHHENVITTNNNTTTSRRTSPILASYPMASMAEEATTTCRRLSSTANSKKGVSASNGYPRRGMGSAAELTVSDEADYKKLCAQEENPNKFWMTLSCSGDKLLSNITGEAGTQRIAHNHSHGTNKWQASCIEVRQRVEENPVISLRRDEFNKMAPWEKEDSDDVEVVHYFETHSEEGLDGYTNVATRVAVGELPGTCNNQTGEGFAQWIVPRCDYIDLIKTRPLLDVLRGSKPHYHQQAANGASSEMEDFQPSNNDNEFEGRPMIHVKANLTNPYSNSGTRWTGGRRKHEDGSSSPQKDISDEELMASLEAILKSGGTIHLKKDDSDVTHETGSLAAYATAFTQEEGSEEELFQATTEDKKKRE